MMKLMGMLTIWMQIKEPTVDGMAHRCLGG